MTISKKLITTGGAPTRPPLIFTEAGNVYAVDVLSGALSDVTGAYGSASHSGKRYSVTRRTNSDDREWHWVTSNPEAPEYILGMDINNYPVIWKYTDTGMEYVDRLNSVGATVRASWHYSGEYIFTHGNSGLNTHTFDLANGVVTSSVTSFTSHSNNTISNTRINCVAGDTCIRQDINTDGSARPNIYGSHRFDPTAGTWSEVNGTYSKPVNGRYNGSYRCIPMVSGNVAFKTSGSSGTAFDGGKGILEIDHTKTDNTMFPAASVSTGPINQITYGSWKFYRSPYAFRDALSGFHFEYNGTWGWSFGIARTPTHPAPSESYIQTSTNNFVWSGLGDTRGGSHSADGSVLLECRGAASPRMCIGTLNPGDTAYGFDNSQVINLTALGTGTDADCIVV